MSADERVASAMSPERWQRLKSVFQEAATRDPRDRAALLEKACDGDPDLLAEVESLLASDQEMATAFEAPVARFLGEILPSPRVEGRRFGAYRAVREIGRGGMAVVYAAVRDDDQYRKEVAIKLIKRGMDTDVIVARFRRERQILANLEHSNIARLLDGGLSDDGLPYLVMEYIEGIPIDVYCDRRQLPTAERLQIFRTVCGAVHSAHQKLVVHRDLKPSNILVTEAGEPKLLDFGIAKLLEPDEATPSLLATMDGKAPMTPEYASPEQVRGQPVTTVSDVYALGVLLYQLLTGGRPYRLRYLSPREIERVICEQEPEKPSTAVGREGTSLNLPASLQEPTEIPNPSLVGSSKKLRRELAGDLDNIVLMALHKAPERRYGSVEQLSEDIRRHLEGLPVVARQDTFAYRTSKFVKRHRWGVTATLLIFLSLVAGMAATIWQARVARDERVTAERVSDALAGLFEIPLPSEAGERTITAEELLDRGAPRILNGLEDSPEIRAKLMDTVGFAYLEIGRYEKAAPYLEEALEIRRRVLASDDPAVALSMNHVGVLRRVQARYKESEELLRDSLKLRRERLGEDHEQVAESQSDLAVVLNRQGRTAEAEPLLRQALALRLRLHGEDHLEVAYVLNNLGLVLMAEAQYEEAERLHRKVVAIDRRLFDTDHPDLAIHLNNLAEVLRARGGCEEAIGLYRESLEMKTRLLGEKHSTLANPQNNLAGCLKDLGRYEEAQALYQQSLLLRREALGDDHPAVADSLSNLATNYFLQGDLEEAEASLHAALALNRQLYGEHLRVAQNLTNLANVVARGGDLTRAEELFREALNMKRKIFGSEHREVADALLGLGYFLLNSDQSREAERYFRESLALWQRWPSEEQVKIATARSLLGSCLTALRRFDEAEPLLEESASVLAKRHGERHPTTLRALRRVISLYESWDRPEQVAKYRKMLPE